MDTNGHQFREKEATTDPPTPKLRRDKWRGLHGCLRSTRGWHDLMTWVTVQSHDIGDTFPGIYALERVFGVGRAGPICPRLRGKSVSWLCRCLRVSRKSAYEGLSGMAQGEYRPLGTGHIGLIIRKKGAGSNRLYEGNSREIRPLPVLVQTGC